MRLFIAPDSFKGSLSAARFCDIARDTLGAQHTVDCLPLADGGEGTCDALVAATGGQLHTHTVKDPLGRPVDATFGILGDGKTAVIEMATACGLPLIAPHERDIFAASTYGMGQLMLRAHDLGVRAFVLGIGGSATNDGGSGMLQALGARLLDAEGNPIAPGARGLQSLATIDLSSLDTRLHDTTLRVACDVQAPLCGPTGAAYIFGPQKGARPEDVPVLDAALARFSAVLTRAIGRDVSHIEGSGAAGGLGAGLLGGLGATLAPGFSIISDYTDLPARLRDGRYDLLITGEGQLSAQSLLGKLPVEIARLARANGIPTIAVVGSIAPDSADAARHFSHIACLQQPGMDKRYAMEHAETLLAECLRALPLSAPPSLSTNL